MKPRKSAKSSRSGSSKRWLQRQERDPFVRKAHLDGVRSRAIYKLEQLDQRDRLVKAGARVLDLGAAPGGWSQYLAGRVGSRGCVVAIDLLEMKPVDGVHFIKGDFLEPDSLAQIRQAAGENKFDLIVSDMAPNLSGIRDRDEARHEALLEAALEVSRELLVTGGGLVAKLFEGANRKAITEMFKQEFSRVELRKPEASRSGSREIYLVAKGYNG